MVLATDTANHFAELNTFKTRAAAAAAQQKVFPDRGSNEDKQVFLNICLHAADIGKAARPTPVYLKWV